MIIKEPLTCVVGSFLEEGGIQMAITFQEYWMFSGSTTVPNVLIQYYRHLQLSADECLLISWLLQRHSEEYFILNVEETCKTFELDEKQLFGIIQHLMDRQVLVIQQRETQTEKKVDYYSFKPLMHQLEIAYKQHSIKNKEQKQSDINLLALIEQEFGRPLSSFEIQNVSSWIHQDHYPQEIIIAALKECVLNQVFTIKYMDKILLSWHRKGIKTLQQLATEKSRIKNNQVELQASPLDKTKVPMIHWTKR